MQRSWSLRPLTKAFEEDTGLKVGSGVAENHKEEEDEDQVGKNRERPITTKDDQGKSGKAEDKSGRKRVKNTN